MNGSPDAKNENPGALGATGAVSNEQAFKTVYYFNRATAATALCHAIADCDPADACEVMTAALTDLRDKAAFGGNPYFRDAVEQYRAERKRSGRAA